MKLGFAWYMALLDCSRVFFELSQCCLQASRPVYPLLWMSQWALEEWFTLPLAISQIISSHTPISPDLICPCDDDSTRSIHSMKGVVHVVQDPHGSIWPTIVTMQQWFTRLKLLIHDHQFLVVQLSREGYASSRLWFHAFEIWLQ